MNSSQPNPYASHLRNPDSMQSNGNRGVSTYSYIPPDVQREWTKSFIAPTGEVAPSKELVRGDMKTWRKQQRGAVFGSRLGAGMRICCMIFLVLVVLLIGVLASIVLFLRPPNLIFIGAQTPEGNSAITVAQNGFQLNVDLYLNVTNPNAIGANFKYISAILHYKNLTESVGSGRLDDASILPYSYNLVNFPMSIRYTTDIDPTLLMLNDIYNDCGYAGNKAQDITIDYDLKLALKIIGDITVTPSFSASASFPCPDQLSRSLLDNVRKGTAA